MFDDSSSDPKNSNQQVIDNSRIHLVSKRSVSDNSDKNEDAGWWTRTKRAFVNFFSKEETPSPSPTKAEVKPIEEIKLPAPESLRRRRMPSDQEDDDEDNEEGSSSDNDVFDDNNEIDSAPTPTTSTPFIKDDKYFRLKIIVNEFWDDEFLDKTSKDFKQLSASLRQGLENLYNEKSGQKILARVVEVR